MYSELKAIASSFYESYNRKDIELSFEQFIAPDVINHPVSAEFGRDNWMDFDKALLAACPNLELTVKQQFVEGEKVVTHWTVMGTHESDFFGMPASGNTVQLTGISIDGIENGKIREHLAIADFTHFRKQFEITT